MPVIRENGGERGFSLMELALMLGIVGLIGAAFLQTYRLSAKERYVTDTGARGEALQAALDKFMTENDRLPCPADPTLPPDHANAGVEQCLTGLALGTCSGGGTLGICRVVGGRDTDADANATNDNVFIGTIPHVTLNIPMDTAMDGWGRKFLYAVSEYLTDDATYSPTRGTIDTRTSAGAPLTKPILGIPTVFAVPFVVMSFGENGVGGYNVQGTRLSTCAGANNGFDLENCDIDSTFYEIEERSFSPGAGYYDDRMLALRNNMRTDRWGYSETAMNDIFNTATARVGIGTDAPSESLDVAGTLRAQKSLANAPSTIGADDAGYCNSTGTNCFPAEMIAGAGVNCNNGAVTGIKEANVTCHTKVSPTGLTAGTCLAGQYVVGFDAGGNLVCAYP